MNLKSTKEKVYHCLKEFSLTRDSDKVLINAVLMTFYRDKIDQDGKISLIELYELPSFESIRRSRQLIQAKGEFPPTTEEVRKKRGYMEEEYRDFVGANPELRKVY